MCGTPTGRPPRRATGRLAFDPMASESRALTARSVLLSVLLGTEPPRLPVRLLVSTTELFGISEGTTRTALSRMAAAGEVRADDGWYELTAPRLIERQARQARSRRGERRAWSGEWVQLVVAADGARPAADRAALRNDLRTRRLGELREGVWLRPDNLDEPLPEGPGLEAFRCRPVGDPAQLAARLWELDGWATRARELRDRLTTLLPPLESGDRTVLADGFVLSAAVLRHLQSDPLLPDELIDDDWPGDPLRRDYDRYDAAYRAVLGSWFDEHR
jgi:phenylacetic acid degradation operon negative regulatory protein